MTASATSRPGRTVQLHFVHLDDTPSLMRRLAAVGITTREACGNSVRNVTACPLAGVCRRRDVRRDPLRAGVHAVPARSSRRPGLRTQVQGGLLGVPSARVRPRQHARLRGDRGDPGDRRGHAARVRGLRRGRPRRGAHEARLFDSFMAEADVLPTLQAIARVFARLGEKRNRARARIKFLSPSPGSRSSGGWCRRNAGAWPATRAGPPISTTCRRRPRQPLKDGEPLGAEPAASSFAAWSRSNVYRQRQPGYAVVTVSLPLGDITGDQLRGCRRRPPVRRRHGAHHRRAEHRAALGARVGPAGAASGAGGLGLAGPARNRSATSPPARAPTHASWGSRRRGVSRRSSSSGCGRDGHPGRRGPPAADQDQRVLQLVRPAPHQRPGFYGVSRHVRGRVVPHFQVVLGGKWVDNGGAYGLAIGAVPARRIPEVVKRITDSLRRGPPRGGDVPRVHGAHRQAGAARHDRGPDAGARLRDGARLLPRLGRSARVRDRRHGGRRMRWRGGCR